MISKTAISVAAGVCGTLFIGYCIYFDRKRRSHPLFKKHLKEKRAKAKLKKEQSKISIKLPDFKNPQAVQKFLYQELQMGDELLSEGDFENCIEHFSYALALSRQSGQMLELIQRQLPPPMFEKLLGRLSETNQKIMSAFEAQGLISDDVE